MKSHHLIKSMIQSSYDIVKAHGGELKVESKEGESAASIIQFPFIYSILKQVRNKALYNQ